MKLMTTKPDHKPALFIQCKGLHSGRPLLSYIPNSFSLYTTDPLAFAKCTCLFYSRIYERYLLGTVIPYIRLADTYVVLSLGFEHLDLQPKPQLDAIYKIEALIEHYEIHLAKWKLYQQELSRVLIKPNTFPTR
jgi:hypothetical protein